MVPKEIHLQSLVVGRLAWSPEIYIVLVFNTGTSTFSKYVYAYNYPPCYLRQFTGVFLLLDNPNYSQRQDLIQNTGGWPFQPLET